MCPITAQSFTGRLYKLPKKLLTLGITSPGGHGLNKQVSGGILPPGWATEADNIVFDDKGRLSSRKGHQHRHANTLGADFQTLHEYVDTNGNKLIIGSADNKIYKLVGSTTTDISGSITTPTDDNWKFQNFNGWCVGYQAGHAPIVATAVTGSFANGGGTQYEGTDVLAAYGRLWTIYGNDLYYSDLLINNFTGGSSGSFDLASYWKGGMDEAVAIADFNGYLVVFGKRNIIVYDNPDDPTSSMSIVENISGIGCIARDTVQSTGDDIVFLSADGVRTLSRVIQEKSMPIGDLSKNNKDYMMKYVNEETEGNIKGVHCKCGNFYLLSLPDASKTFYLDFRQRLEDGAARTTEWDLAPTAMMSTIDGTLYFGATTGHISNYTGYLDGVLSDGTGGTGYTMNYEGAWNDAGQEASSLLKIPKSLKYTLLGGNGQTATIKWAFDYEESFHLYQISIAATTGSEWGIAEWNIGEWSGGVVFNKLQASASGTGQVFKLGFTIDVVGAAVSIQRIDMKLKTGRTE